MKQLTIRDDRTKEQRRTHTVIIVAEDTFMSGWGEAEGGTSWAGWACRPEHADKVEKWVSNRNEMENVKRVGPDYKPDGPGDYHIYAVDENHNSLN